MQTRRFIQCDVFSPTPTLGNALAVVVDGEGLSDQAMLQFSAWTNLAETTFIKPPTDPKADYAVRIFTTTREMLFAGHPTLGSCFAWLHAGGKPKQDNCVVQECGVGLVEIDISDPDLLAFTAPPTQIEDIDSAMRDSIMNTLDIKPEQLIDAAQLDNGPVWQFLELDSAETVLALDSSKVRWPTYKAIGVFGKHSSDSECDYEVRMLAPSSGMSEDPITGSLNSAVSHWLQSKGRLQNDLLISQGSNIGRHGRVTMKPQNDGSVKIAGATQLLIEGTVQL